MSSCPDAAKSPTPTSAGQMRADGMVSFIHGQHERKGHEKECTRSQKTTASERSALSPLSAM